MKSGFTDTWYLFLISRADLVRYIYTVGRDLCINVDTPPARRVIYQGGTLEQGGVQTYKKNLIAVSNIHSSYRASRGERFDTRYVDTFPPQDPLVESILQGE